MQTLTTSTTATAIDMLTPTETCAALAVGEQGVIDLVNGGRLPAYRIGGHVRFKVVDVMACREALVAA